MNYTNFGKNINQYAVSPSLEQPPKKDKDTPQVETKIDFIVAKKDGRLWVKHQTIITDWKAVAYYETAIARKRAESVVRR